MVSGEHTPRAAARRPGWGTSLLLLTALGLILAGIFLPALSVNTFYFWTKQHSIYSGTMTFFHHGQAVLGTALFCVSIAFPLIKIVLALLVAIAFSPGHILTDGLLSLLALLSRWSMTDVFILAVAVLILDGRLITSANLLNGAYYFAGGILLSSAAVYSLLIRARRWPKAAPASEDSPA